MTEVLPLAAYEASDRTPVARTALRMAALWGVPMGVVFLATGGARAVS